MVDGILNLNKPPGMTSFAVVARVKRLTGVKRVGHAGTLDPTAEGVLPVCLGRATRVVEYLVDAPKTYRATVILGTATDTYDSEGAVTATGDPSDVSREDVEEALLHFVGQIEQLPPSYSAVKYRGKPLYKYARAGREAPRTPRLVTVHRLTLLRFEPPRIELEMVCGRGAYARTLAHDLGVRLGCWAHLEHLVRLRSGPFALDEAVTLETFERAVEEGWWEECLVAPDRVLESWRAVVLGARHTEEVRQGQVVVLAPVRPEYVALEPETLCRAYSTSGEFVAILQYRGANRWHPERVFLPA